MGARDRLGYLSRDPVFLVTPLLPGSSCYGVDHSWAVRQLIEAHHSREFSAVCVFVLFKLN